MKKLALSLSALAIVASCGGGSGGSGSGGSRPPEPSQPSAPSQPSQSSEASEPSVTQFSSFEDAPQNGTVLVGGKAVTATYTYDPESGALTLVGGASSFSSAEILAQLESGNVTRLSINGAGNDVTFGDDASFAETEVLAYLISSDGENRAILVTGSSAGAFNYQTYGVWMSGYNTGTEAASVGSFGSRTTNDRMPSSGSATYTGDSFGVVSAGGAYTEAQADFAATADFDASTLSIASSNTQLLGIDSSGVYTAPDPNLDFTGSGDIDGASFNGTISSARVAGGFDGHFYGPNAEEIGGTFQASGPDATYVGSFGGKQ